MIKLKNITLKRNDNVILKNVAVSLQQGDFVIIVGQNGAGKSTLLDLVAGNLTPTEGHIYIDGQDVTTQSETKRSQLIGRLYQNPHLNTVDTLTIEENLALATIKARKAKLKNIKDSFPRLVYEQILKPMNGDIEKLLKTPMGKLSGGQRQMIALVMATLCKPKILLLDEPTAALDPQSATRVLLFIAQQVQRQGITTLMITHDQNIATSLGNKLWILQNGTIEKELTDEKRTVSINHLMGEIDYKQLATLPTYL